MVLVHERSVWTSMFTRTTNGEVKPNFILCFGSNRNVFYLYMKTSVAGSNTLCYVHAWLYKGYAYCQDLSVPCSTHPTEMLSCYHAISGFL